MARPYAPKVVLRHLPLHLIRAFLAQQHITVGTDWDALTDGDERPLGATIRWLRTARASTP